MAFDPSGNLYVADAVNNNSRVIDSGGSVGTITRFAASPARG